jgi:hypothetical protein
MFTYCSKDALEELAGDGGLVPDAKGQESGECSAPTPETFTKLAAGDVDSGTILSPP